MKIFQISQKNLVFCGFIKNQSAFNKYQLWTIFKSIAYLVLQFLYLFRVANTPKQYMDSIFMTTAGILIVISHIGVASKTATLFNFIDDVEQAINESESVSLDILIEFAVS